MDLLRLTISKDALIDRQALYQDVLAPWTHDEFVAALPSLGRGEADSVRLAVTYRMRRWQRFAHDGAICRASARPTKGAKGLDLRIHVESRYSDEVRNTETGIMSLTGGNGKPLKADVTQQGQRDFPELVQDFENIVQLAAFGQVHCFESDLRRLCDTLLEHHCTELWPGIRLVLTAEAHARTLALQHLLGHLSQGTVSLRRFSLDNTPANREALARELGGTFTTDLEKLLERAGYPAPDVAQIRTAYETLSAKIALIESVLGVDLPCLDAQVAVELALAQ